MSVPCVVIIEGGPELSGLLASELRRGGYQVAVAHGAREGLRWAQSLRPDLIILDLRLPLLDLVRLHRDLRADDRTGATPTLFLAVDPEEPGQVVELARWEDGSPLASVAVRSLAERLTASASAPRSPGGGGGTVEHLGVRLDLVKHQAYAAGRPLALTPGEFRLLECLVRSPGRAFSRAQLLAAATGNGAKAGSRMIDVYVKSLRRKLGRRDLIETVHGVGYRFREGGG